MSVEVRVAHTSALGEPELQDVLALFHLSYLQEITESDVEHCLGGMHALLRVDGRLVGHGSVVQRRLLHAGRALRTGYVEAVAVHPDHRRQGHGGTVMAALEQVIRGGYELGALCASPAGAPLYRSRGWQCWTGPTSVLAPDGLRLAPEHDSVYVLPVTATVDPTGGIACDWREGDVW